MIKTIITFFPPIFILGVMVTLYRSKAERMIGFYQNMSRLHSHRVFYVKCVQIGILFYILAYMLICQADTMTCLAVIIGGFILPTKQLNEIIRTLRNNIRMMFMIAMLAVVIAMIPNLYPLGITLVFVSLAVCFYPSQLSIDLSSETRGVYLAKEHNDIIVNQYYHR